MGRAGREPKSNGRRSLHCQRRVISDGEEYLPSKENPGAENWRQITHESQTQAGPKARSGTKEKSYEHKRDEKKD